jgi:hypothetical protein
MKNFYRPLLISLLLPSLAYAQLPLGFVAKYQLNNNTANDISGNNYNGTLKSTTATVNRFGVTNAAVLFKSGSSYGTLPVMVENDFSIGFWMKTTMNANSGTQWYQGQSLVDAEVCGVINDWGTALINGGKVAFGVGNPDITIISPAGVSYNDGSWHFVTVTRSQSLGASALYMDGVMVTSGTGLNTGVLNSPSIIGLGRNNCTGADYAGALDDIIFYNRVLSSAEVTTLYNTSDAYALPLNWLSFTGQKDLSDVNLSWLISNADLTQNFIVERSTDAINFSEIGNLAEKDGIASAGGNLLFSFSDLQPFEGINYYRINEVGPDGTNYFSKILAIKYQQSVSGIHILANPVHNMLVICNPGQQSIGEMELMDMTSRELIHQFSASQNSLITINVTRLIPGYYLLRIKGR